MKLQRVRQHMKNNYKLPKDFGKLKGIVDDRAIHMSMPKKVTKTSYKCLLPDDFKIKALADSIWVKHFLYLIGENVGREGLKETPTRVAKMWKELYRGYDPKQKPTVTVFPNHKDGVSCDQMIVDTGYFYSQCEHHLVPFFGKYYFAYVPGKKVLGLSKVARIVDYYAAKLQVQERLGKEIVDELERELKPQAIGLVLKARHLCKEMRGVKKIEGEMITSDLRGKFRKEPETRAEFMGFINNYKRHV